MQYDKLKGLLGQFMYLDKLTVIRQTGCTDDDGADDYELKEIYKDIPCKLSQYGKEIESHQEDRAYVIKTDLRVCISPEYVILSNDVMKVTHQGQIFTMNAAQAFVYPTHQEISVRRKDEA